MKKKVYISGPITGHDIDRVRGEFMWAEGALMLDGYDTANPLDNGVPEGATWAEHMRADIKMLLDCDTIFMLEGWRDSRGASLEHLIAVTLGMIVMHENTHKWQ